MNHQEALGLLKTALNDPHADFRDGQWEAIDTIVNHRKKLLVIQRTGWGKSSVYFISTWILRDRGFGPTIIISPLLALMRNQISSAQRLGIKAVTLNSTNTEEWASIRNDILENRVDCLLISPERLANDNFIETLLRPIADRIGLLVVDEAHCISDWGHDFRPDYRRIVNILRQMPPNLPVLGTTATANNRVIEDIQHQLGDIVVQRGPLIRESLALQTMVLPDQASRLAWLTQVIPTLAGTGIVYTLTKRDANQVAEWLNRNGIQSKAYYSGVEDPKFENSDSYRQYLEELLFCNQIKVLVATTALGMGYDKPDLGFVIHYQAPGSIVAYYQQVGRAGRGISSAVGVLMSGSEDEEVHEFFRTSAFPSETEIFEILNALDQSDGLNLRELEEHTNLRYGQIEKALKFMNIESNSPVIFLEKKWHKTVNPFNIDHNRIEHLTHQREDEWAQIQDYLHTDLCLMTFLRNALDDYTNVPCGKCANCLGRKVINVDIDSKIVHQAGTFLKHAEFKITPKKQVAANAFVEYGFRGTFPVSLQAEEGRVLSKWGDSGWGKMVADDKHAGYFRDELVNAMVEMIKQRWNPDYFPTWVCCVTSLKHPELVPDFAKRLAKALNLPFIDAIQKIKPNAPQKMQQNRYRQCKNLDGVFQITQTLPGPVFLVDDVVDSGWTFTVITALLRKANAGKVYPVALASTSKGDE